MTKTLCVIVTSMKTMHFWAGLPSLLALLLSLPLPATSSSYPTRSMAAGLGVLPLPQPVTGPESLAFDRRGGGPYTGVSDGRVLRWSGRRLGWTEFAYNSKHESEGLCKPKEKVVVPESVCGRPLGLQFHKKSGDLYIADAYLGLMRVGASGGLAEVVAAEAGGVPFNFLNGLDVDQETGDVYFTDSSINYHRSDYMMVVILDDTTGRLMKYDPQTKRITILYSELSYPNGVAISADRTHLVVSHTSQCQLVKYWIRGMKTGKSEVFVDLPGYPDNVRVDPRGGGYWVALSRDTELNSTSPLVAVRVSSDGQVVEGINGFGFVSVSEVAERNGDLWLGSVDTPYAGLLRTQSLK